MLRSLREALLRCPLQVSCCLSFPHAFTQGASFSLLHAGICHITPGAFVTEPHRCLSRSLAIQAASGKDQITVDLLCLVPSSMQEAFPAAQAVTDTRHPYQLFQSPSWSMTMNFRLWASLQGPEHSGG